MKHDSFDTPLRSLAEEKRLLELHHDALKCAKPEAKLILEPGARDQVVRYKAALEREALLGRKGPRF